MNGSSLAKSVGINPASMATATRRHNVRSRDYQLGVTSWLLADMLAAFIFVLAACALSPAFYVLPGKVIADVRFSPLGTAAIYALLFPVISHVFALHNPLMRREKLVMVLKYIGVGGLAVVLLAIIELLFLYTRVGRHILLYTFVLSSGGMVLLRLVLWRVSEERKRRLVLVGSSALTYRVRTLVETTGIPYEVVPLENVKCIHRPRLVAGVYPLACLQTAEGVCGECGIHEIVACYPGGTQPKELMELSHSLLSGVQVSDYGSFIERTFFKVPVEQIGPDWFFTINTSGDYALYRAAKRMIDLVIACAGLILAAPVVVLMAVLLKLESRGPVFYSQVRVGQFNSLFRIWKLRSMRQDAEVNGAQWALQKDSRVTRIGRILRLTRLDEVPQFWNVLRGEMSLIGPRPERPHFVEQLASELPFYRHRHLMKPGITGWAQINYPYGATKDDALNKLKYDLYYIKYASLTLDVQIVLRTIGAVMKGAR
jgi:exopolysaccharide biosynthesis polyprenyl glycosylphosphotransferase